ncbi:MAG: hypothetical protein R2801_09585 [Chitinophagales bacterium]
MIIAVPKETKFKENRVAITPTVAKEIISKGFQVIIEAGAGLNSYYNDDNYTAVGCKIASNSNEVLQSGRCCT